VSIEGQVNYARAIISQIERMSAFFYRKSGSLHVLVLSNFKPELEKWAFVSNKNKIFPKLLEIRPFYKAEFAFIRHVNVKLQTSVVLREMITRGIARFPREVAVCVQFLDRLL